MSENEVKSLLMELADHVSKAANIADKINAYHDEEAHKGNVETPTVLHIYFNRSIDHPKMTVHVHLDDALETLHMPIVKKLRKDSTYPYEYSCTYKNVNFFEIE